MKEYTVIHSGSDFSSLPTSQIKKKILNPTDMQQNKKAKNLQNT